LNAEQNVSPYRPFIIGVGGTLRKGSSSERALAASLKAAEQLGAETEIFAGPDLMLPHYSPDSESRTAGTERLVAAFRRCDGLIISTPAYHGSISGMVKNALDYTEDLRTDQRVYLDGLAVGCIACAGGWQAAGHTLSALRPIAHALRGWPTPLGVMLNTSTPQFDPAGNCADVALKAQLELLGRQVAEFAFMRHASVAAHSA
jgi:FMN reductase